MSSVNSEVHHEALIDRITVLNVYYNVYRIRLIRLNFTIVKSILTQCEIVTLIKNQYPAFGSLLECSC